MHRILPLCALLLGCANAAPGHAPVDSKPELDASIIPIDATPLPDAVPDANNCATQPCDILTQCGCTGACDIDTMDLMGTACRMVTTMGHETTACDSADDCDRGYACLGSAAGHACKKYCATNTDCGAPRGQCVIDITNGATPIPDVPSVCSSSCDPTNVAAGGCPATWKCGLYSITHQGTTFPISDCTPTVGPQVQGGNCKVGAAGDDGQCAADFLCTTLDTGTNYACRRMCNKTLNTGCGGLTCLAFAPPQVVGGTEYGVCN